jgi:hypothetical protein
MLKAPGTSLLKLRYDEPISNVAFKLDLRRYNKDFVNSAPGSTAAVVAGPRAPVELEAAVVGQPVQIIRDGGIKLSAGVVCFVEGNTVHVVEPRRGDLLSSGRADLVGPGRNCLRRHMMPLKSRNEGSNALDEP